MDMKKHIYTQEKPMNINELKEIFRVHDVHDAALENLAFDFEKQEIMLKLSVCDSLQDSFVDLIFTFGGVFKFESDTKDTFRPQECFSVENLQEIATGKFEASFYFIPYWLLTIGFASLSVQGGIEKEEKQMRSGNVVSFL